jgi:hypothetical protein
VAYRHGGASLTVVFVYLDDVLVASHEETSMCST